MGDDLKSLDTGDVFKTRKPMGMEQVADVCLAILHTQRNYICDMDRASLGQASCSVMLVDDRGVFWCSADL